MTGPKVCVVACADVWALGAWLTWLRGCEPTVAFIALQLEETMVPGRAELARVRHDARVIAARCDALALCGGAVDHVMVELLACVMRAPGFLVNLASLGAVPPAAPIANILARGRWQRSETPALLYDGSPDEVDRCA